MKESFHNGPILRRHKPQQKNKYFWLGDNYNYDAALELHGISLSLSLLLPSMG